MKNPIGKWLLISVTFLTAVGTTQMARAACTQTLNPGSSVASAISSATAGSTICLNAGNYGTANISGVVKSATVTVQSTAARGATVYLKINQSSRLRFQSLTVAGMELDTNQRGGSNNIAVTSSTFKGQAVLNMGNNGNANVLIDGNTFDGIGVCANCYEGRLQVIANPWSSRPSGVVVSNNHFGNGGESDGIQNGANGVVIGPGNVFEGIKQGSYSRHVDAIQFYGQSNTTVTGNYFFNNDVAIMSPDGGRNEIITNNVFVGGTYVPAIQLGSHAGSVFTHNTVIGINVHIDAKSGMAASSNVQANNNILIGQGFSVNCTGCTFDRNLYSSSSIGRGTNSLFGTPAFAGGSRPTTWAGHQLLPSSIGYRAASDGQDVGATTFGAASLPAPPVNLQVQ